MRANMRRALALLLILLMTFSSISFADGTPETNEVTFDLTGLSLERDFSNLSDSKLSEELINFENEDTHVRIIVEFNNAPIIQTATAQGLKVTELSETTVNNLSDVIIAEQDIALQTIEMNADSVQIHERFETVFNGVSMTVLVKDLKAIADLSNVKSVSIANEYARPETEPYMNHSSKLTNSLYANEELDFRGEGLVVAIIDTGIDPSHKDMQLNGALVDEKLDAAAVGAFVLSDNLPGRFFTTKVPYGYNYMDKDGEIRDLGPEVSMHGMHVAGTVAADGEIKGVAPKAQVLAMKVFGNDPEFPSTFGDVIIAAIDDSITLGADVMNLSLGSTAAFVDESDPEQQAITRATENGIVMAISAGNSAYFGNGLPYNPLASNPDIGVVGSPGLVYESLQVASVDNYGELYNNTVNFTGIDSEVLGYAKDAWDGTFELVAIGGNKLGIPSNYDELDVAGKIVLVSRGGYSFFDKTENAYAAGAAGIIVYNNGGSVFYKNQGGWSVPFMKISTEDGAALEALLETQDSIEFTVTSEGYTNPTTGSLSSFSSWGVTPDLGFKPDIAAPGGNIWSLANNNEYQYMSGTSMAAPHAAGGAALVIERINEDPNLIALNLENQDKTDFAKNLMMNTAVPVKEALAFTSPRGQGAGSMDLRAALETIAVAYDSETQLAKVNLGEIANTGSVSYDIDVKNFGTESVAYDVEVFAQAQESDGIFNYISSMPLENVGTTIKVGRRKLNGPLIVKAGQTKTVTIIQNFDSATIDGLAFEEAYENGGFVEGFVVFAPAESHRAAFQAQVTEAEEALAENTTLIQTLTDELAQLELDLVAQQSDIDAKAEEILISQALVDAKQAETDAYVLENVDVVADVLELIGQIEAAQANLDASLNGYNKTKDTLIENAQAYSLARLFQGNYEFLDGLFDVIDEIADIEARYARRLSRELRIELKAEINEVISVLNQYEVVINSLTVDGFLALSQEERTDLLKDLRLKVKALQEDLNRINEILLMIDIPSYETYVMNRVSNLESRIAELKDLLIPVEPPVVVETDNEGEEPPVAEKPEIPAVDVEETQKEIDRLQVKKERFEAELVHVRSLMAIHANVQESIALNDVILVNTKSIKEDALIVDNAQAALDLLKATYNETDLTDYDVYLLALDALKVEKGELVEGTTVMEDAKIVLETELEALNSSKTTKTAEKVVAEEAVANLTKALNKANAALIAVGEMVDRSVELSVPYTAFKGAWGDAPIFDKAANDGWSFYGYTGFVHNMNPDGQLTQDINAISPNDDGYQDSFETIVSFLRNLTDFEVQILDESKTTIKVLKKSDYERKHYFDGSKAQYKYMGDAAFDGYVNYKVVDDGQYYLRFKGNLATGEGQDMDLPFFVDTELPTLGMHAYSRKTNIFSATATDSLSGVRSYTIAEPVLTETGLEFNIIDTNATGVFDISELETIPSHLVYSVEDYAGNTTDLELVQLLDYAVPAITMTIEPFTVFDYKVFNYTGTLVDINADKEVLIDGVSKELTLEEDGSYSFEGTVTYETDGKKGVLVEATDLLGNRIAFTRWFYVDSNAATIALTQDSEPVEKSTSESEEPAPIKLIEKDIINYLPFGTEGIDFEVAIGDNFPSLTVRVNESVKHFVEHDYVSFEANIQPIAYNYEEELILENGLNLYVVEVTDAAGTVTENVYKFYVLAEDEVIPELTTITVAGKIDPQAQFGNDVTETYTVTAVDQNDKVFNAEVVWTVVGENVEISDTGVLTIKPEASGSVTVVATSGNVIGELAVEVTPYAAPVLTEIVITGEQEIQAIFGENVQEQYTFTTLDQYGEPIEAQLYFEILEYMGGPVLEDVTVDENGLVTFTSEANGEYYVYATSDTAANNGKVVIVTPYAASELAELTVKGETLLQATASNVTSQYQFDAVDQYGQTIDGEVLWSVDGNNATIDTNGLLTIGTGAQGTLVVKATSGEVEGELTVTVAAYAAPVVNTPVVNRPTNPAPAVVTIKVALNETAVELEVGTEAIDKTFDLDATVTGTTNDDIVWASSDDTVATVDENGVVTAIAVGTATITASREAGSEKSEATVEVFLVGDEEAPLGAVTFTKPYMSGNPDGTFRPNDAITRAELAVIYTKVLGLNTEVATAAKFNDVDASHWSYNYVQAVARTGIFSGYKDGTFKPDQVLSRAELAATFAKFWDFQKIDVKADAADSIKDIVGHWASEHIFKLYNAKVLEQGLVKYDPDAPALRGQVVIMVNTLLGRASVDVTESKFSDVDDLELMGAIEAATQATVELNK